MVRGGNQDRRARAAVQLVAAIALVGAVFGGTASSVGASARTTRVAQHGVAVRTAGALAPRSAMVRSAGLAPYLTYRGGHLLQHVKIDLVVWNRWAYDTRVPLRGPHSVTTFLAGMAQSPSVDWLREYNTANPAQQIGRGSLEGTYVIRVNPYRNGDVITDHQIQRELTAQMNAGKLPWPDPNRLFVVYFPSGHKITVDGTNSHHDFCAYHNAMTYSSTTAYYAVMPFEVNNTGCQLTGANGGPFASLTDVTSHEVMEAITDPGVGLKGDEGWYDDANGEIGDICAWRTGTLTFADGAIYVLQQEWSNQAGACVVVAPTQTPVPSPACISPMSVGQLHAGECLKPGTSISSPQHGFTLALETNGQLVLWGGEGAPWVSGTINRPVTEAIVQPDGNFVIYGRYGALWSTGTGGHAGAGLYVQDDGNVVLYSGATSLWCTGTAGACGKPYSSNTMLVTQCLSVNGTMKSPNGNYALMVQANGSALLTSNLSGLLWSTPHASGTQGLVLQGNGDLALIAVGPTTVWHSNTAGRGVAKLVVQDDGNVVLYSSTNTAVWSTGTAGRR